MTMYTPLEVNVFYQRPEEQRVTVETESEEQAVMRFKERMNRSLLRALRRGNYFMLDDHPPDRRR